MNTNKTYAGLRVCDLGQGVAAPHASMLLAIHGADVIKVEPPGGEWGRQLGAVYAGHSANSFSFNVGKRSIELDLKSDEGHLAIQKLIGSSHVFIESFRPGVAAKLGLSYEEVRKIRPDIIYVSLSGFGQVGPKSTQGTVDIMVQAYSGMMNMNKSPEGTPFWQQMPAVDVVTGLYTFAAIAMAVTRLDRTREGSYLDISLVQSAAMFQSAKIVEATLTGGGSAPLYMPVGLLRTANGWVAVSAMKQAHFEVLCEELGLAHLSADVRFKDKDSRLAHGTLLMAMLNEQSVKRGSGDLVSTLQKKGVLIERVNSYAELLEDPQSAAMGMYRMAQTEAMGTVPLINFPGSGVHQAIRAPKPGEHTQEILRELNSLN